MTELVWKSADGKRVALSEITTGHLVNILNWVNRPDKMYTHAVRDKIETYAINIRVLSCFANGEPYPYKTKSGTWVLMDADGNTSIEPPPEEYAKNVEERKEAIKEMLTQLIDKWDITNDK